MVLKGGRSVEANQVHRNKLRDVVEGNAWVVVDEALNSIRDLTVADIGGDAVVSVHANVRDDDFTEDAVIWLRRDCLIRAQTQTYPAILTKEKRIS